MQVILKTSLGDIDIELWPKEAPKVSRLSITAEECRLNAASMGSRDPNQVDTMHMQAVRNFVQLCLEGYYDNTPFFRIDKGFMAQAGDPTGTGLGGESVYGHPFNDEFHSRLKFNHRSASSSWSGMRA